jgi:hypothetical protein
MGHWNGKLPALNRRRDWLKSRIEEANKTGRRPLRYDVDELRELEEVLGKPRPQVSEEPPRLPRERDIEEVYEVPGATARRSFFGKRI